MEFVRPRVRLWRVLITKELCLLFEELKSWRVISLLAGTKTSPVVSRCCWKWNSDLAMYLWKLTTFWWKSNKRASVSDNAADDDDDDAEFCSLNVAENEVYAQPKLVFEALIRPIPAALNSYYRPLFWFTVNIYTVWWVFKQLHFSVYPSLLLTK